MTNEALFDKIFCAVCTQHKYGIGTSDSVIKDEIKKYFNIYKETISEVLTQEDKKSKNKDYQNIEAMVADFWRALEDKAHSFNALVRIAKEQFGCTNEMASKICARAYERGLIDRVSDSKLKKVDPLAFASAPL